MSMVEWRYYDYGYGESETGRARGIGMELTRGFLTIIMSEPMRMCAHGPPPSVVFPLGSYIAAHLIALARSPSKNASKLDVSIYPIFVTIYT
jgi:hypothetical protein